MHTRTYRLTVVGCAVSWLLVGMHLPALHQMTHHGATPPWSVVGAMLLLAAAAVAGLWTLLRAPSPGAKPR